MSETRRVPTRDIEVGMKLQIFDGTQYEVLEASEIETRTSHNLNLGITHEVQSRHFKSKDVNTGEIVEMHPWLDVGWDVVVEEAAESG